MTGNTDKVRAVFLALLMVFSVFAGTVAFSGSAAAASPPTYDGNAVHFVNSSGTDSNPDKGAVIEIPFTGNISENSLKGGNFTLLDDGDDINDTVSNVRLQNNDSLSPTGQVDGSTVLLELDEVVPSNDLEVSLSADIANEQGNTITNPGDKTIVFAGQTLEHDTAIAATGGGGEDSQANSNTNVTVYQGTTIAVNASNVSDQGNLTFGITSDKGGYGEVPVTVEGEDNNYFQEGNTGPNSTVFTFDTSDRELGKYRIFLNNTDNQANRTFINVRDLGLDISVDDLNVSTDDTIETTASATAGNRNIEATLLDSNGDTVNTSSTESLDGQGEADIDFETGSADEGSELDPGTYTVEVTDNNTGITVESSEIQVSQADDEEASFAQNTITEERGDILEVTVEMTETSEATINFGSSSDGVQANATVEDDDGDDQVTVFINTYKLASPGQGALLPNSDSGNVFTLDSDSDDQFVDRSVDVQTSDLVDAGDYDLEVQAGDQDNGFQGASTPGIESSDDVATVTLNERSTQDIVTHTASADEIGSFSDLDDVTEALEEGTLTQSSEVAVGDLAVHQLRATGLEGALTARANEEVTREFLTQNQSGPINFTIEEADPGANQEAKELNLEAGDGSVASNFTVIADGPNDTYFLVVDTGSVDLGGNAGTTKEALPNDDDTALETNFTVTKNDQGFDFTPSDLDDDENEETLVTFDANEPEINVDEPFNVSQAEAQTVTGDTNIAPGTELSLRIRSEDGVSPSFLKTASPVVQSDGTYSATFDFSEQNVGDTYDIEVDSNTLPDGPVEEDGEVLGSVATDTATPEPDTDTATPEPDTDTATPEPDTDTATPEPDTDTATPEPDTDTPTSTPTSTPGFGVIVALTALLAAALLAIRRD